MQPCSRGWLYILSTTVPHLSGKIKKQKKSPQITTLRPEVPLKLFRKNILPCLLVRAISALNPPVTPFLHADTGTVLAGELVVSAGRHGHVPAVLRPAAVIVDLPGLGSEQERSCRGRAESLEISVF